MFTIKELIENIANLKILITGNVCVTLAITLYRALSFVIILYWIRVYAGAQRASQLVPEEDDL